MTVTEQQRRDAVRAGLRAASVGVLCLLITEMFHLDLGYLGTATALNVASDLKRTSFQKAIEDLVGRVFGYAYCVALVLFFRHSPLLCLTLLVLGLLPTFYLLSSGRLAYGATVAGLYMVVAIATSL